IAFSDGKKSLQNGGVMMRALQYVKAFDGLIMNHPDDHSLSAGAQMHEGRTSTSLGMRGIPAIAEELMLQRDIYLLEYTESRLHVANVSTRGAVDLLRTAKAKGLAITASVAIMNLVASDEALSHFDTHYKVLPPLREKEDIDALLEGLKDGTIDFIASNHMPWEKEAKDLEFPYAKFGAIGMETLYALCNTHLSDQLSHEDLVRLLALRSRDILGLPLPEIAEGADANLTLFHPKQKWIYHEKDIRSRSKNSPFIGQEFLGKVMAIINNGVLSRNAKS
ncbi:MAG: dihydroorotase, partial [Bacteroidota bacterium]